MRVKCLKILSPDTGEEIGNSPWLTVGAEYIVLSLHIEDGGNIKFQLLCDDGYTPSFHNASQFEVISSKISSTWRADFVPNSYFSLGPKAWSKAGFWDAYFDGNSDAELIFEKEKKAIFLQETGRDQ